MSSLKEIKSRIASVKNTLKITSAMKMVASAKLHKAQTAIGNKLPYEQKLHRILAGLLQSDDLREALVRELGFGNKGGRSPVVLQDVAMDELPSKKDVERVALVVFSSNSSLFAQVMASSPCMAQPPTPISRILPRNMRPAVPWCFRYVLIT